MADSKERSTVPSWDGSARTWRRYTREVAWYLQGTPVHKRRYCASQLLGRLTGPARLLAMSWSKLVVDSPSGTKLLLQKLAASPLVRKSLPNAAAICQQYFAFKRQPHETIGSFLVRETLVQEEFTEALIRLHEEKLGLSQDQKGTLVSLRKRSGTMKRGLELLGAGGRMKRPTARLAMMERNLATAVKMLLQKAILDYLKGERLM